MVGLAVAAVASHGGVICPGGAGGADPPAGEPNLGPNVLVFDPSMSTSDIQTTVDAVEAQQIDNQFGSERYELLFKPGTYGSATDPLNFQVGYYTAVAGLGLSPERRRDQRLGRCLQPVRRQRATASRSNNFWRSLENLTINVSNSGFGCHTGEFWAVSQAAPMRRVNVHGPHDADGLLLRSVVRERRFHRGLAVRHPHRQRVAAAVGDAQQRDQRLVQRGLEPGLLGRHGRAGRVLPGRRRRAAARTRRWPPAR